MVMKLMPPFNRIETERPPDRADRSDQLERQWLEARMASAAWAKIPLSARLQCLHAFRHLLTLSVGALVNACEHLPHRHPAETLAAEIMPLADAARFLVRRSPRILHPHHHRRFGLNIEMERRPLGLILIVGPSNYPLFLPGVQVLQAIAAGNAVLIKPGDRGSAAAKLIEQLLISAGVPRGVCQVTTESPAAVHDLLGRGINKLIATGSQTTGAAISAAIAKHRPIPAVMELSGSDAVFVLADADLSRAAAAVAFGMSFNGGATCMAPRRVLVHGSCYEAFLRELLGRLNQCQPTTVDSARGRAAALVIRDAVAAGAKILCGHAAANQITGPLVLTDVVADALVLKTDQMLPLICLQRFHTPQEAVALYAKIGLRLGASVFGPVAEARQLADTIDAGCICINDILAPTGAPEVSLTPRGESGFGSTRGAEGLLEMTTPVCVVRRTGNFLPHLVRSNCEDDQTLNDILVLKHSRSLRAKAAAMVNIVRRPSGERKPAKRGRN